MFLYLITSASTLSSCSLFLQSSVSYYPRCCSYFLFPLLFLILLPLLLLCLLVPLNSTYSLCSLLLCLVSLYYSWSYYPCCCSVFLFSFSPLDLITPAASLSICSPLLFFILLSLLLLCLLVPFFFTLLSLIIPAAALSCSLCYFLSYYPCCCSVYLFPFFFFILLPLLLGGQWLSGRVLDSRPKGHRFEHHRRHCVVS